MNLKTVTSQALALESALLDVDAFKCSSMSASTAQNESCLQREDTRPLTKVERAGGNTARTFDNYDPERMCLTCRAYWHAAMCHNALKQALAIVAKYG